MPATEPIVVVARAGTGIRSDKVIKKSFIVGRPGGVLRGGEVTLNRGMRIIRILRQAGVKLAVTSS